MKTVSLVKFTLEKNLVNDLKSDRRLTKGRGSIKGEEESQREIFVIFEQLLWKRCGFVLFRNNKNSFLLSP